MARTQRAKIETNGVLGKLEYKFSNGQQFGVMAESLDPHFKYLSEVGRRIFTHGLKQKLSDSYADPDSDAYHEVRSLFAELEKGVWSQRAESGGPRVTLLAIALANLTARKAANEPNNVKIVGTDEEISAMVEKLDALAEQSAVEVTLEGGEKKTVTGEEKINMTKKSPVVDAEIKRIMAERATAKAKEARQAAAGAAIDLGF